MFEEKTRLGIGFYLVSLIEISVLPLVIYTVSAYDRDTSLLAMMCALAILQSLMKFVMIADLKQMFQITDYFQHVYEKYSRDPEYRAVCAKYVNLSQLISKGTIIVYGLAGFIFQLPALLQFLMGNEINPFTGIHFPPIAGAECEIKVISHIYSYALVICALVCLMPVDSLIGIGFVNFLMIADIFDIQTRKLREILDDPKATRKTKQTLLMNIILTHRDYIE